MLAGTVSGGSVRQAAGTGAYCDDAAVHAEECVGQRGNACLRAREDTSGSGSRGAACPGMGG